MRIEIGDYIITKDAHQFIINELKIAKSGKNEGEESLKPLSYHPRLEQLVIKLMEMKIGDVSTLDELLTCIRSTRKLCKERMLEAL